MKFVKIVLVAVIFVLFITLVLQNQQVFTQVFSLKLDLNFFRIGPYLTTNLVLIATAFLIGVLFAVVWGAFYSVSVRSGLKEKDRRVRELEKENEEIRTRTARTSPSPSPTSSQFKSAEERREEEKKEEKKGIFGA